MSQRTLSSFYAHTLWYVSLKHTIVFHLHIILLLVSLLKFPREPFGGNWDLFRLINWLIDWFIIPGTSTSEVISPVSVVHVFIAGGGCVPSSQNGENGADLPVKLWEISPETNLPPARHQSGKLYSWLVSRHVWSSSACKCKNLFRRECMMMRTMISVIHNFRSILSWIVLMMR